MQYKLIISDYDGTFRHRDNTVGERTVSAVREYVRRGGKFVICTGRMPSSIRPVLLRYVPDGLYVVSVAEGSDAAAKGLAEGDVITAIDGQGVTTTAQVGEIIAGLEVGDTITMTVYRNGETFDVEVALVETSDIY